MKNGSTLFLKVIIIFIGLLVASLCVIGLPSAIPTSGMYRPILIGMYLPALPFFIAIYHGWKLLRYIDNDAAFSDLSVRSLRIIKYCALIISILYALGMPYIFRVADLDDAPGVVLIGLVFTFGPLVIAVFAAVLQELLKSVISSKSENDLTI